MENSAVELFTSLSTTSSVTQFLMELGHEEEFYTPTVFNLSGVHLTEDEVELLKKGLKFAPTPKKVDNVELKADFSTLSHKIKWKFAFSNNQKAKKDESLLKVKTHSKAPPKPKEANKLLLCSQIENTSPKKRSFSGKSKHNMPKRLYDALESLQEKDLIIKEADKGSGVVIMTKDFYDGIILNMLEARTYEEANIDCSYLVKK